MIGHSIEKQQVPAAKRPRALSRHLDHDHAHQKPHRASGATDQPDTDRRSTTPICRANGAASALINCSSGRKSAPVARILRIGLGARTR